MKTPLQLLLVEDSEDDAHLLLRKLRRSNYEPNWRRVQTLDALKQALDEHKPDIIIADYAMPRFNGLAALSHIRRRGQDIPFIMVSGTVGEEFAVEVMRAGAQDYLMKDNLSRLIPAIKRELHDAEIRKGARQAQHALRASERRLQLALVGANDGIWDWDITTGNVAYSPRWAEMLEFPASEVRPSISFWKELIHPKDKQMVGELIQEHLDGDSPNLEFEHRLKTRSGEWRWILTRGKVVDRTADGAPLRAAGTNKDITEQKRLEEQLRQAQKMESIGMLAGGIAHDFNNLLTVILGHVNLELANFRRKGETESGAFESLEQIGLAADRAAALTRQLLAFSRRQVMKMEILAPDRILGNLHPMLQRIIGEHIKLRIVQDPEVHNIRADAGLIEQVIMNLIVNARDAMPSGGELKLETVNTIMESGGLRVQNPEPTPCVLLKVIDTGVGMPRETLERIFEPFFTTKPVGKGTGLGLATAYGIVKQFGGHIEAESEPGVGTTFKVYFPAVDLPAAVQQVQKDEKAASGGQETILLCEDEEIVRNLSLLILQRAGYNVIVASDGIHALEQSKKYDGKIDLLVTDLVMPDMSGYKLAEHMLEQQEDLPVLIVSGYNEESVEENESMSSLEFLTKPFRPQELLQRVRYVLDK